MSEPVFISICIPAYKNTAYLERLISSISIQTFKNYEVVISDDSPDDSVRDFISELAFINHLRYYKNATPLGTPENWNAAISMSKGEWIKIMHDDDWFSTEHSLQQFVDAIRQHPEASFIYASYTNVDLHNGRETAVRNSGWRRQLLNSHPFILMSKNVIGPPSAIIYQRQDAIRFDNKLKWLVDIDFYIRYLRANKAFYVDKQLVKIGISANQVTKYSSMVREVEIPEFFAVLQKCQPAPLKNVLVFDALWRLIRNFQVKNSDEIVQSGFCGPLPDGVSQIIKVQSRSPGAVLKIGIFSKLLMLGNYTRLRIYKVLS